MEGKRVDESWKQKVVEEKSKFSSQPKNESVKGSPGAQPEASDEESSHETGEVNFINFISGLAAQTMMALGQMAHPGTNESHVDLDSAKYLIDTIEMIQKKTKGNLTPEEDKAMQTLVYQLKMVYVKISKGQ